MKRHKILIHIILVFRIVLLKIIIHVSITCSFINNLPKMHNHMKMMRQGTQDIIKSVIPVCIL